MRKSYRITICFFIGLLGALATYLQLDLIYRIVFMDLNFFNPLIPDEIFFCIILLLITLSTIPTLIFHIRRIKSTNTDKEIKDPTLKATKMLRGKFNHLLWFGNFFFGLLTIGLAEQILSTTISDQIEHNNVAYYNYFVSGVILFFSIVIILDALKNKSKLRINNE